MFYTYILRSLSQPEQRYIGSTADLKACLAIRRFFCLQKNKRSKTERAKDARNFILRSFNEGGSKSDGGLYGTEQEKNMFYTYILRSISHPEQRYIGSTSDLKSRLAKHNAGEVPHTSKFKPWKIETAIAFSSKEKAYAFEAYLKTHSGRSFSNRHF